MICACGNLHGRPGIRIETEGELDEVRYAIEIRITLTVMDQMLPKAVISHASGRPSASSSSLVALRPPMRNSMGSAAPVGFTKRM